LKTCPFCSPPEARVRFRSELALGCDDAHPLSPGHTLIVSRRHVGSFFELTPAERTAITDLLDLARRDIVERLRPDAFNVGINDGPAAGQSIPHVHVHLIPRYRGDRANPRGGVRWVIPEKADYWSVRGEHGSRA
jgi:diadenosine tetraphosphate (Ap4A) HIT family hydrolase